MTNMIPQTERPDQDITVTDCPPWCTRPAGHDATDADRDRAGVLRRIHFGPEHAVGDTVAQLDQFETDGQRQPATMWLGTRLSDDDEDSTGRRLSPADARTVALTLLADADPAERAPRRIGGPRRHQDRPIVSRPMHDVWCGWRIATRDDQRPELGWCAGCGLAVEIGAPETTS